MSEGLRSADGAADGTVFPDGGITVFDQYLLLSGEAGQEREHFIVTGQQFDFVGDLLIPSGCCIDLLLVFVKDGLGEVRVPQSNQLWAVAEDRAPGKGQLLQSYKLLLP